MTEGDALTLTCQPSSADPVSAAPGLQLLSYSWLFTPLASEAQLTPSALADAANQTVNWTGNAIRLQPDRSRAGLYYCIARFNASDDRLANRILVSTAATRLFVRCVCARERSSRFSSLSTYPIRSESIQYIDVQYSY